jgi:zinc transport system substrate-binding protein
MFCQPYKKKNYQLSMIKNIIFLILTGIISGCTLKTVTSGKKIISVSILPQKYFVEAVAGDKFTVNVMIPPGGTPENYEPTAIQMQSLSESVIYMRIGHIPFEETWMKNLMDINPRMKVYDLSSGISLITGGHHHEGESSIGVDPHIWSSPLNAKIITSNIFLALAAADPANKDYYALRLQNFHSLADSLDKKFQIEFARVKGSSFLVFHPALAYLAKDYGLNQIALEFEGKTPPPGYMKNIINMTREKKIRAILMQKQFNSEPAETIAKEISGKVIIIDPLDENWKDQIVHIAESIIISVGI